jgi:hypothetical protein
MHLAGESDGPAGRVLVDRGPGKFGIGLANVEGRRESDGFRARGPGGPQQKYQGQGGRGKAG